MPAPPAMLHAQPAPGSTSLGAPPSPPGPFGPPSLVAAPESPGHGPPASASDPPSAPGAPPSSPATPPSGSSTGGGQTGSAKRNACALAPLHVHCCRARPSSDRPLGTSRQRSL